MRFYVGSSMKNSKTVKLYAKKLQEHGWYQTYDWTKNINNDKTLEDMIEYAKLEKDGILESDVVCIILPAGRGAHIELGMALALNKKIFLCSEKKEDFDTNSTVAFYELPNIIRLVGNADNNVRRIVESF